MLLKFVLLHGVCIMIRVGAMVWMPAHSSKAATQPITEREHASKSTRSKDKGKTVMYILKSFSSLLHALFILA